MVCFLQYTIPRDKIDQKPSIGFWGTHLWLPRNTPSGLSIGTILKTRYSRRLQAMSCEDTRKSIRPWRRKTIVILIVIAKLDLDNKGSRGLSRMYPRHDEHYFHLFKNDNRVTINSIVIYLQFVLKINFQTYFVCWGKIISILPIDVQCHLFNSL